jgi:hypothetical protein
MDVGIQMAAKAQMFFWLLLNDRLKTKMFLGEKNMQLESYTCENIVFSKERKQWCTYF